MTHRTDHIWDEVLAQARIAACHGEVPVGAVITRQGEIIARAHNQVEALQDPLAHAEKLVIERACTTLKSKWLEGCYLYVSLEPCIMCAGAIMLSRLERVYFGAPNPKIGAIDHGARFFQQAGCTHYPEIYGGFREGEASTLLQRFFAKKR
ncbi:MAG: nucleoside deaminase [Sphaerospermopsis sp. SIO1G2]|nr:nucleoside deaminase [Sphaerospermopsis sp. SIO1G2]